MRKIFLGALIASVVACSSSTSTPTPSPTAMPGTSIRKEKPPFTVGSFSASPPAVTLAPGEEQQPCWLIPLELPKESKIVGGARLTVGRGMHHGNITTRPKTGEGVRPCSPEDNQFGGEAIDVTAGGAVLFGSSTQFTGEEWQGFPSGMGYRLKEGFEIVARMHHLNASSQQLTVAPRYEWFVIDEAKLTQEVAPFTWIYKNFRIPPRAESFTAKGQCKVPRPMHIVQVLPHMHRMGKALTAGFSGGPKDGQLWLDSKGYDPDNGVMLTYDPPIDTSEAEETTFACTWKNTTDKELVWGVGDNEMCELFGYAWPPANTFSLIASESSCSSFANAR